MTEALSDERLAFLIGAPDWENTHLGDEVEAALRELQQRRASEAKLAEFARKVIRRARAALEGK